MKPFFHAVWLSLRYKWSIAGAVICAIMISLLWSMSITTIYPIVVVVLQDETAVSWAEGEIRSSHESIADLNSEVANLERSIDNAANEDEASRYALKLNIKQDGLKSQIKRVSYFETTIKPLIDRYAPETAFGTLSWAIGFLLVVSILKGFFLVASSWLTARVASKTVMDMRRIYYRKALELDQKKIDGIGTSNIITHLAHNMMMVNGGLMMFYGKCIREPLKMITCLVCAAMISMPLLLVSLIMVPAGTLLVNVVSGRMKSSTQSEMKGMSSVFQSLIETFSGVKTVRIFNRERTERRRFKACADLLYNMSLRISLYDPLKPNQLILFYALLAGASDPVRKMTEVVNVLVRGGAACDNLFKTYDIPPRISYPRPPTPMPEHQQSIEFKEVIFCYKPRQPVLRKLSLTIPYGQTVAIVGGNGSGKTTLVNLLARFYDPNRGTIKIDGVNLKEVNPRKLRRQIAWVTQDSHLFQGTIWENIAYGRRNATDEEILAAANIARLGDFVDKFEDGYQTVIGDDGNQLSAGQRQRVAMARAIVADPRIFVLDEATSQIDGQTETLIHADLAEFIKSRTTIIITHRRSSLDLADRVIVMHDGRIAHDSSVAEADANSLQFQHLFSKSA